VLPGPNDVAIANGFTVTIDQNIDVQRLSNSTFGTSTNGGFFQITTVGAGVTRNVFITLGLGNLGGTFVGLTGGLLRISATSGTVNLGSTNVASGSGSGFHTLLITGAGVTVNCTGNLSNAGFGAFAVYITAVCTATFNDVLGNNTSGAGISINAAANVTVNRVTSGTSGPAIILGTSNATLNVLGPVTGTGMNTSLSGNTAIRVETSNINITCFSSLSATGTCPAIAVNTNGDWIGNYTFYGPFFVSNLGVLPVYLPNWRVPPNTVIKYYLYDTQPNLLSGNLIELSSEPQGPYPNASDVLLGVNYNSISGTLSLPPVNSVSFGAKVGNSEGAAFITEEDVLSAELSSGVSLSEKILNSATVSSSGDQVTAFTGTI
jgi:hypothetical protein